MHSKEFAELLGAFTGDGWISKNKKGGLTFVICGNPKDEKEYYQRVARLWEAEFAGKIKPRAFPYWGTFGVMCCNRKIIKQFESAGMARGKKANICKVPEEIQKNKVLYVPFIRGLFDTDGSIFFKKSYNKNASRWQKSNNHIPVIQIASVSQSLIESIRKMLSSLGFKFLFSKYAPKNKNWNTTYYLRLSGKINTINFFARVQPKNSRHRLRFEKWLTKGFY